MDENKNIHRLRVITFGKDGAGSDYFVEQIGDTSPHLIPSKKIISNNNSKDEDIHTITAREHGDNLYNVNNNQRTTNANVNSINHPYVPNGTRDQHLRNVRTSQKTNDTTKPSRPDPFSSKEQTALNTAIKRLTAKGRQSPSPISNRERRKCPEVLMHNTPQRENEENLQRARSNKQNKIFEILIPPAKRDGSPKTTNTANTRRSAASLFRIPCKKKVKNHAHYRILNTYDVKRSVSHHGYICSDRIKQILEPNTSKPKTKNKYISKLSKRNDDVNVLFSREAPDTKDCKDIFGFRKHNRFRSSVSVYQQYKSHIIRPKRPKSNTFFNFKKSYSTDHIPLRVMTSRRTKSGKSAESVHGSHFLPHVHRVNVVEFPEDNNFAFKNQLYRQCHKSFENVGIDPSARYVCNDAECETAKVNVESVGLDPDHEIQQCDQRCFTSFGPNDGKDNNLIITVVKYILFGLVILVWSPCILVVIIFWLITYPLRPSCIRAQGVKRDMFPERLQCGVCHGPEQGFWSSFVKWIKSAEWFNRDAYKAVVSLVKKKSKKEDVKCQHKLHPNPNRQYTLYHSAEKGWIMKPIRFDGKQTEILNVLCDPHKRAPKKQPISKNKEKKKVRITTPADMPSDFGTVPPAQIKNLKYGKKSVGKNKAITPQPRSQPPSQPQDPCMGYCPIPTCKKHNKPKKTNAMSSLYDRARQDIEADPKARCKFHADVKPHNNVRYYYYANRNAGPYADPNAQATASEEAAKGKPTALAGAAKGEPLCLSCISRTAPCARPPCKDCSLRILNQLRVGNYVKGKTNKAKKRNEKKGNLVGPKYDTRHVGEMTKEKEKRKLNKYDTRHVDKMATEKEKRKLNKYDTRHVGKITTEKEKRKLNKYDTRHVGKMTTEKTIIIMKQQGNFLQRYFNNFTHEIREAEKAVWFPKFKCGRVYKMCPAFHPAMDCRKQLRHLLPFRFILSIYFCMVSSYILLLLVFTSLLPIFQLKYRPF